MPARHAARLSARQAVEQPRLREQGKAVRPVSRQAAGWPLAQAPACSSNRQGRADELPVLAAGNGEQFGRSQFVTELAFGVGDVYGELLETGG
jgi:hypothetical protein